MNWGRWGRLAEGGLASLDAFPSPQDVQLCRNHRWRTQMTGWIVLYCQNSHHLSLPGQSWRWDTSLRILSPRWALTRPRKTGFLRLWHFILLLYSCYKKVTRIFLSSLRYAPAGAETRVSVSCLIWWLWWEYLQGAQHTRAPFSFLIQAEVPEEGMEVEKCSVGRKFLSWRNPCEWLPKAIS